MGKIILVFLVEEKMVLMGKGNGYDMLTMMNADGIDDEDDDNDDGDDPDDDEDDIS